FSPLRSQARRHSLPFCAALLINPARLGRWVTRRRRNLAGEGLHVALLGPARIPANPMPMVADYAGLAESKFRKRRARAVPLAGLGPNDLLAAGQGAGGVQQLAGEVVVKLLVGGGPVLEAPGDRAGGIDVGDGDRLLRAVARGHQVGELEPGRDGLGVALAP